LATGERSISSCREICGIIVLSFRRIQEAAKTSEMAGSRSQQGITGMQRFPAAQELLEQTKFDEFRARFKGGSVAARSAAEKQQLFGSSASGRKVRASGHKPLVGAAT
jgi:hypothetical protein